jgi:hypothetical protein
MLQKKPNNNVAEVLLAALNPVIPKHRIDHTRSSIGSKKSIPLLSCTYLASGMNPNGTAKICSRSNNPVGVVFAVGFAL